MTNHNYYHVVPCNGEWHVLNLEAKTIQSSWSSRNQALAVAKSLNKQLSHKKTMKEMYETR